VRTALFRLCGQPLTGPTGVVAQGKERMRRSISDMVVDALVASEAASKGQGMVLAGQGM